MNFKMIKSLKIIDMYMYIAIYKGKQAILCNDFETEIYPKKVKVNIQWTCSPENLAKRILEANQYIYLSFYEFKAEKYFDFSENWYTCNILPSTF